MSRHTLLLADDSITTQRVLELTFAEHGVRVIGVTDGEQALEQLKAERPDIVLADVGLAKVNGYKLAAHITQQPSLAGIPVVLLIGAFDVVDEERVTQSGAAGTLVKPLESGIVIKRVKELLGFSRSGRPAAPTPWDQVREESGLPPDTEQGAGGTEAGDYFDRLDAAFESLDARLAGQPRSAPRAPEHRPAPTAPARPVALGYDVADVFESLLAAEQGEPSPVHTPVLHASDEVIERIATRVAERLTQGVFLDTVNQVVADVSERLVKEEIARIRRAAQARKPITGN